MATINAKFRASKVDGKEGAIYYQILHNRVVRQLRSGYTIHPNEWCDDGDYIVVDDSNSERAKQLRLINDKIGYDIRRFYKLAKSLEATGQLNHCDDLVFECQRLPKIETFFGYYQEAVFVSERAGKLRTSQNYNSVLKSFYRFRDGEDLILENVSSELIAEYENYLKKENVSMNTISYYIRNLRAVYNKAVASGVIEPQNIFTKFFTGNAKTAKPTLSLDDVRQIKECELPANSTESYARDIFLFSFYTKGMAFVDMFNLRKSDLNCGMLSYQKRQIGQRLYIKWEPCMQEIVDRYNDAGSIYLLPIANNIKQKDDLHNSYMSELIKVNQALKRISKRMGLEATITMNVARNSWALAAKTKNISIPIITESLGYANDAETTLYLESLDRAMVDDANSIILRDVVL